MASIPVREAAELSGVLEPRIIAVAVVKATTVIVETAGGQS